MTTFYSAIAPHYDQIFPLQPSQVAFVLEALGDSRRSVLEIGAATGTLSLALSRAEKRVVGIDLNPDLLRIAAARVENETNGPTYIDMDMTRLAEGFPASSFDGIVCVGNTLVHLDSPSEIGAVLHAQRALLETAGILVLQIINYDRILDQALPGLPTIENDHIVFERIYDLAESGGRIGFETRLTIKATGETMSNRVSLFPLRQRDLAYILAEAGFHHVRYAGTFQNGPFIKEQSQSLIAVCRGA